MQKNLVYGIKEDYTPSVILTLIYAIFSTQCIRGGINDDAENPRCSSPDTKKVVDKNTFELGVSELSVP